MREDGWWSRLVDVPALVASVTGPQPQVDWAWHPHKNHVFLPVNIVEQEPESGIVIVETASGEQIRLSNSHNLVSIERPTLTLFGVDDVALLPVSSGSAAPAILHTLRSRFGRDQIHVRLGSQHVITVNPWKTMESLYSPEAISEYVGAPPQQWLPPHAFCVLKQVLTKLFDSDKPFSHVISILCVVFCRD